MNKLIQIALAEVGYLEKKSNSQLESKTLNAGSNNYTKYGKAQGCNGQAWCDAFVDWCFIQAYGKDKAKKLLGGFSNYTPTSAQYFKNMKQWYKSDPKIGDIIFFKNTTRICHTGIVYAVDDKKVYTIEGNTSAGAKVIPNGGAVCMKSYNKNNLSIAGYGRPKYDSVSEKEIVYYPKYTGTSSSIVDALQSLKIDSNLNYRKKIAAANNINNYSGTADQNKKLLNLLKNGKLIKP